MSKKTICVNLVGAPGSGKSTGAAYIFSKLKMEGINCELVIEYAKDRVWQNDLEVFRNQFYVSAKQSQRMARLQGKVDIIVTDSPLLMAAIYAKDKPYYAPYKEVLKHIHEEYENINCLIERVKPYNPKGRFQDEAGADQLHIDIRKMYKEEFHLHLDTYMGNEVGYNSLVADIIKTHDLYHKE
jgi:adenylate kinase family enzyme